MNEQSDEDFVLIANCRIMNVDKHENVLMVKKRMNELKKIFGDCDANAEETNE